MVCKCAVLLRVKHLEERARRIPAVILCQLIDLVQDHDRVGGAAALHGLHDPSGHGSDVSPPVPADLCFIPDAAQADADIFPPERTGNALPDTGLPGAGGSDKEKDRAILFFVQGHDCQLLDDTLFYLF